MFNVTRLHRVTWKCTIISESHHLGFLDYSIASQHHQRDSKKTKPRDEKIMLILFAILNIKRTPSLRLIKGWYGIILSIGYTCHTIPGKRKHEGKPGKDKTHDNRDQEWKMPSAYANTMKANSINENYTDWWQKMKIAVIAFSFLPG